MPEPLPDLWEVLSRTGAQIATEEDYEHGYVRRVREDLRRVVAFRVTDEVYALPIDCVDEVSRLFECTPVPRTADFLVGIGSVRGNMIPVIDLPTRLRLRSRVRERGSRIIIVRHDGEHFGLVVDEVLGVVALAPEELEPPPSGLGPDRYEFIAALGRYEARLLILLNLDTVLDARTFVPGAQPPKN